MNMQFWQEFALRICWLLGTKADHVEEVTIQIRAGKLPRITITKSYASEGELKQVFDVFEATHWEQKEKAPEQTFKQFLEGMKQRR